MAEAKCRFCDQAADADAYCSTWTADLMAKGPQPLLYRGKRKKGASWSYP